MKIEDIDEWVIKNWIHGDSDDATDKILKLVLIAQSAKSLCRDLPASVVVCLKKAIRDFEKE